MNEVVATTTRLASSDVPLQQTQALRWQARAAALILAVTGVRLLIISVTQIADGEAYYFTWSRFLDWSYYDHPPLIAWLTWLTTRLSGAPWAVRFGPVLCASLFSVLLYRLAEKLFSPRAGFWAVVVISAIPAFAVTGFVVNPEAPLAPLWMLFLLLLERMRREDAPWLPLAAGLAMGLAFLAKYTGVLTVLVAFTYAASSPPFRRWLRRPSFYLGGAVALAATLPVALWNQAHDWPTLKLHLVERTAPLGLATLAHNALDVLVGQLGACHPLLLPALLAALGLSIARARRDDRFRFLACASAPVLLFFLVAMIRVRDSESHWTMVAFMPLAIALGAWLDEVVDRRRALGWYVGACAAVSVLATLLGLAHSLSPALLQLVPARFYDPTKDVANETVGWDKVKAAVAESAGRLGPGTVVASSQYALCAHLLLELDDRPGVFCPTERRSQFDFWGRHTPPAQAPVVFVDNDHYPADPATLMPGRHCELSRTLEIARGARVVRHYRVFACEPKAIETASASPPALPIDR